MEKRISLTNLADSLRQRSHISEEDSVKFVKTFVEVLEQCLLKDNVVKIKGFGTFKLMTVEGRESIDINSGNRILIGAHAKVTFTPDAVLKDAVNKPFADFSTVVLNDDTPVAIMDSNDEQDLDKIMNAEVVDSGKVAPEDDEEVDEVIEEMIVDSAETEATETETAEIDCPMQSGNGDTSEVILPVVETQEQIVKVKPAKKGWWILGCILCFIVGFMLSDFYHFDLYHRLNEMFVSCNDTVCVIDTTDVKEFAKQPVKDSVNVVQDTLSVSSDTIMSEPVDSSTIYPQFEYGAYQIVGVLATDYLRPGKDLAQLALKYYGTKDFVVYITVMNHIDDPNKVASDAKILIPKLELKKHK